MAVGFDYAPPGWALCNGQLLPIKSNVALFTLLGTAYGGDGTTTFGLPDLRGRTIVGASPVAKTGITPVKAGEKPGAPSASATAAAMHQVMLATANLPAVATGTAQVTGLNATSALNATTNSPGPTVPAPGSTAPSAGALLSSTGTGAASAAMFYVNTTATPAPLVPLSDASVKTTINGSATVATSQIGSSMPQPLVITNQVQAQMSVMQPSLGTTYIICTVGLFPSRG
jgi:microcystin-dependent protein